jgi:Tol biopolymer transport system component
MIPSSALRPVLSAFSLALLGACNSDTAFTTPTAATPEDSLATPAGFPPLVGRIAFTSTRDGSYSIYVAAADGSSLRRLAAGVNPAWSPDGQQLAFTSTRDGSYYTYVAAADGSSLRRLAAGVNPAWSPDGQQLAFKGTVNAMEDTTSDPPIYVINADGSGEHQLPVTGVGPVWSPDSRQLAYGTDRGIYVANSDGSNPRQLVSSDLQVPGETVGATGWSPDGSRIAFVSGDWEYTRFQLYVVNVDGSGILPLTPYDPKRGIPGEQLSAKWSPDGSKVACEEVFGATSALGIANADGSLGQTATTSVPFPGTPDWSPDGRILSFTGWTVSGTRIFATDPVLHATIQLIPNAISPARRPYDDFNAVWSRAVQP